MRKIVISEQFQIEEFKETAMGFFKDILNMDYDRILVTDKSELSDFAFGGGFLKDVGINIKEIGVSVSLAELNERWDQWVIKRISDRYGIVLDDTDIYLVTLFQKIKDAGHSTDQ